MLGVTVSIQHVSGPGPDDFDAVLGLVTSLSRPGGNVTGASLFTSEVEANKLALLRELVPTAPLIAMMVNPTNPSAETDIRDVQKAAGLVRQPILLLKASRQYRRPSAGRGAARCPRPVFFEPGVNSSSSSRLAMRFLLSMNFANLFRRAA
jgi:hypothetical protein